MAEVPGEALVEPMAEEVAEEVVGALSLPERSTPSAVE